MNQRLLSVLIFALVVASVASFLVYRLIASHVGTGSPASSTVVVVANKDLEVGALVHESDIRRISWSGPVPEQAASKLEDVTGRGVTTRIYKDEVVLSPRLAAQGAGAGLAANIPIGMRAVALRVNDVVGLAGFVLPGMRVDVLVAGTAPGADQNRTGTVSKTVLQNLEVLSANQKLERDANGKPEDAQVVNLLVTPDQAEILNLASGENKVQLVLRNPLDTREAATSGSTSSSMYGLSAPAPITKPMPVHRAKATLQPAAEAKAAAAAEPAMVEMFSGAKRSEQRFDSHAGGQ